MRVVGEKVRKIKVEVLEQIEVDVKVEEEGWGGGRAGVEMELSVEMVINACGGIDSERDSAGRGGEGRP